MVDTSVKTFDSTSNVVGMPVLNGSVGSLINVLSACLVNGVSGAAISSFVIADGVGTITTSAPHYLLMIGSTGQVISVSGASLSEANGEWRVSSVTDATHFLINMEGVSNATVTGASFKLAPLGWTKPFSGTNKAVYKGGAASNGHYLQVADDSTVTTSASGRWAKWCGYEFMTDLNTGTNPFPVVAQVATGLQVLKSDAADTTRREWSIVGDSGGFLLTVFSHASYTGQAAGYYFGKTGSLRAGDSFDTLIVGDENLTLPSYPGQYNTFSNTGTIAATQNGKYLARSYTQVGSSVHAHFLNPTGASFTQSAMAYVGIVYPCPVNNGLIISPVALAETATDQPRNLGIAGLYMSWHAAPLNNGDCIDGVASLQGRALRCYVLSYNNSNAQCMIDITGPWR